MTNSSKEQRAGRQQLDERFNGVDCTTRELGIFKKNWAGMTVVK